MQTRDALRADPTLWDTLRRLAATSRSSSRRSAPTDPGHRVGPDDRGALAAILEANTSDTDKSSIQLIADPHQLHRRLVH